MKGIWIQSGWEAHVSQRVYGACFPDGTFNAPINVLSLYIRARLRFMFLLRFHKALCLLQFSFSCASANFSFKGIVKVPLTTFDFPVSFSNSNLVCWPSLCCSFFFLFFFALFIEYFWVIKFLFPFEGAIIIRRRSSGDDVACGVWDIPRFGEIPIGSTKFF